MALALIDNLPGLPADWLPRIEAAELALPDDGAAQAAVGSAYRRAPTVGQGASPLERGAMSLALDNRARRAAWRRLAGLARAEGDEARVARCNEAAAALD